MTAHLVTRPAAEWLGSWPRTGVPAGPVNSIAEAVTLATDLGLAPVVEIADPSRSEPSRTIAHPVRLLGHAGALRTATARAAGLLIPAPQLDQANPTPRTPS